MRILIVDDSRAMRLIIMRELRRVGLGDAEFREAVNGLEALDMVDTGWPTVILADWNMPVMSGLELLEALRARHCRIPLGFITAEATPEMRARAAEAGARFLVVKPFTAEDLREALDTLPMEAA